MPASPTPIEVPPQPAVYHITHVDNLPGIIAAGEVWSDAERIRRQVACTVVGMSSIKERRLRIPVDCHPTTRVGEYVPFYFCPRSIMLYLLHMGNHPEITYRGGQGPIVHLVARLHDVVAWAVQNGVLWAFTTGNAAAGYVDFLNNLDNLDRIDWKAVAARDWRSATTKEAKQAEFLLHRGFPWTLVKGIGVQNDSTAARVVQALGCGDYRPEVRVLPNWYY